MDQTIRNATQLGAALRRRRRALGLTQTALAEKTHLRQATISDIENGVGSTRLDTLLTVLAALDLELATQPRTKSSSADIERLF